MIRNPFTIVICLIAVETAVLFISSRRRFKKYFSFLPAVFWIYFIPMLLATTGMLDSKSPVYGLISVYLLPASLVLLLLSSDIMAILRLGPRALVMMLAGSFGIMLGTCAVVALLGDRLGEYAWSGFGSLSGSWIGGSANMIAVKEALGTPDAVFTPMVVVDTIVPYAWMGILIALAGMQVVFDRWNKSDAGILKELQEKAGVSPAGQYEKRGFRDCAAILFIAFTGGIVSWYAAGLLPVIPDILSRYAWIIICVSFLGVGLSFTPLRGLGSKGATDIGYYLLYFVLTSIGAKASIDCFNGMLLFISAGFLIVLIHGLVLLVTARVIRAPLFLIATASQANIGGVASAPVVAAAYQPGLASVGLLLAILGNIIGTYLGIITGRLCSLF
jgi:uncharacterized membrane protein